MHTDAYDALVNLKKYIREQDTEPTGRAACIRLVDEFMKKAVALPAPYTPWNERKCICVLNQEAVNCPKHGNQPANREPCPICGTVLGYCAEGEYCTSDTCRYIA